MRKLPESLVVPDYENSIVNLSSWILKNFGIDSGSPLDLDIGFDRVGLIILDAFGYTAWEKVKRFYSPKNLPDPNAVTSVFPSTTTAALTSIFTASKPAEHGMLGYILFLKEFGFLVNMIDLAPVGYQRDLLKDRMDFRLKVKTVFERLKEIGVLSSVLIPSRYMQSGFSKMLHAGAKVVGYTSIGDFLHKFSSLLSREGRRLVVGYVPNVDSVGHKESERAYLTEAAMILSQIDRLVAKSVPKKSVLVITADHGMVRTPRDGEVWWGPDSPVMDFLCMPPGGERRMMHLYTRRSDDLLDFLEENHAQKGVFLKKDEALELFGGDNERIGDVVLVALENNSFNFKYRFEEDSLRGMHGGLSRDEMLVPLFYLPGS